ncbi:MAG: beta-ketoacyl-[acyl-carrier-protein] synthase family protein [Planctomycetota bacterium]
MISSVSAGHRRVVVTGEGFVTPFGRTSADIWSRWSEGHSAARSIMRFDARSLPVRIACEVVEFQPRKEVRNRKLLKMMTAGEDFAFRAAHSAIEQSNLESLVRNRQIDTYRCGLSIACHKEGFRHQNLTEAFLRSIRDDGSIDPDRFVTEGWSRIPPQIIIEALSNIGMYSISHDFELRGPNYSLLSVGIGGLQSLGEGLHAIEDNEADVMVAGAFDSWINWMCIGHNVFNGTLSQSTDSPQQVHRPFDANRSGAVPAEGAAMFVLEELQHALDRGAPILGELLGASSAVGLPERDESSAASTLANCIRSSLDAAGCTPDELDLIQLHGDGTISGDRAEALGIRQALGDEATRIPATTVKSGTGLMGVASGPTEAALAWEALRRGEVLPIINLDHPETGLDLNFVRQRQRLTRARRALVIQRGWPGLFAALVIGSPPV